MQLEIGSMNSRISLEIRNIQSPLGDDVNYGEEFTKILDLWAYVETINGASIFDGTNTERIATHKFYIRWMNGVTFQDWIKYQGILYDLIKAEDDGEEHKFYTLWANVRGTDSLPINYA